MVRFSPKFPANSTSITLRKRAHTNRYYPAERASGKTIAEITSMLPRHVAKIAVLGQTEIDAFKIASRIHRPFLASIRTCCVCVVCAPGWFLSRLPFFSDAHTHPEIIPTILMMQRRLQAFRNVAAAVNLIFESSLICNAQQKHNEEEMESKEKGDSNHWEFSLKLITLGKQDVIFRTEIFQLIKFKRV